MQTAFAALAEPSRYRIVELLRDGPQPVNDVAERLSLTQPQVSKHLRVLKEAGWVDVEPRAQQRVYRLRPSTLRDMHAWLESYRRVWDERFDAMDAVVEELVKLEEKRKAMKKEKSASSKKPNAIAAIPGTSSST